MRSDITLITGILGYSREALTVNKRLSNFWDITYEGLSEDIITFFIVVCEGDIVNIDGIFMKVLVKKPTGSRCAILSTKILGD